LRRTLQHKSGIQLDHFLQTELRRTFTYCKPLMMEPDKPPMELNRLDSKNWMPTPALVQGRLVDSVRTLAREVDAMVVLDQVDVRETGVVTKEVLETINSIIKPLPNLVILGDSRRVLRGYPPVTCKMDAAEWFTIS